MKVHQATWPAALGALAVVIAGCDWVVLARNASSYPETRRGEAANVAARDTLAYATAGDDGLVVVETRTGKTVATVAAPAGSESVDDVVISGDLLFVLDARPPGYISGFSISDPLHPILGSEPQPVPVGPFSGVSAGNGVCIVSGGISELTVWSYDSSGRLTGPIATTDLGRGQPDVLISRDCNHAFVASHYWGPYFGLDVVRFDLVSKQVDLLAELELDGAGFTDGGAKPANFPIEMAELNGDTLLIAYARGVAVVDVSSRANPKLIEVIDVGGAAVNVDVLDRTAAVVVAAPSPFIVLLHFRSAAKIVDRISLNPGTVPLGVALTEENAVVAARDQGVLVFER